MANAGLILPVTLAHHLGLGNLVDDHVDLGIAAAVATLILVQGASCPMVIYQSLVNRFVIPVIERHEARGRAEGIQAQNEIWNAWLQRKEAAEAEGIEFNEPPPRTMALWGNGAPVLKFRQLPR